MLCEHSALMSSWGEWWDKDAVDDEEDKDDQDEDEDEDVGAWRISEEGKAENGWKIFLLLHNI